jgi:hypothetical protein
METLDKSAANPKNQPVKLSNSAEGFNLPARIVGAVLSFLFLLVLEFALTRLMFAHA